MLLLFAIFGVLRLQRGHCLASRPTPPRSPDGRIVDDVLHRVLQHVSVEGGQNVLLKAHSEGRGRVRHFVRNVENTGPYGVNLGTILDWIGLRDASFEGGETGRQVRCDTS